MPHTYMRTWPARAAEALRSRGSACCGCEVSCSVGALLRHLAAASRIAAGRAVRHRVRNALQSIQYSGPPGRRNQRSRTVGELSSAPMLNSGSALTGLLLCRLRSSRRSGALRARGPRSEVTRLHPCGPDARRRSSGRSRYAAPGKPKDAQMRFLQSASSSPTPGEAGRGAGRFSSSSSQDFPGARRAAQQPRGALRGERPATSKSRAELEEAIAPQPGLRAGARESRRRVRAARRAVVRDKRCASSRQREPAEEARAGAPAADARRRSRARLRHRPSGPPPSAPDASLAWRTSFRSPDREFTMQSLLSRVAHRAGRCRSARRQRHRARAEGPARPRRPATSSSSSTPRQGAEDGRQLPRSTSRPGTTTARSSTASSTTS